jgi:hypothetical protein
MPQIKLKVIEPPAEGSTATVLMQQDAMGPIFTGQGAAENAVDYLCGKCDAVLAKNVRENQLKSIVMYCNKCMAYNRVP